jgi:hypothetical protein
VARGAAQRDATGPATAGARRHARHRPVSVLDQCRRRTGPRRDARPDAARPRHARADPSLDGCLLRRGHGAARARPHLVCQLADLPAGRPVREGRPHHDGPLLGGAFPVPGHRADRVPRPRARPGQGRSAPAQAAAAPSALADAAEGDVEPAQAGLRGPHGPLAAR